jgi:subtilase family serine protease
MKRAIWIVASAVVVFLFGFSISAAAQSTSVQGHVLTPASSLPQPPDAEGNIMVHTAVRMYVPSATQTVFGANSVQPSELPPFPGYFFETPASIACLYNLVVPKVPGCNPNITTANPIGGSHAIALVDAYDDPTAASDLATFSTQFGLPAADFTVVYSEGVRPKPDPTGGWELEEALDVEWAYAMAPGAKIFLVEAPNNSLHSLLHAVEVASKLVAKAGGGEVSMGWGSPEFTGETKHDHVFTKPGVVYFAAAGDSPGTDYPSASPNVVSAGGTSISRNLATGDFIAETAWQDAGGGLSPVEARPAFQNGVKLIVGDARGTPDVSFDGNPNTGVWVYDSNPEMGIGWFIVGGTSVSTTSLAGIVNAAGGFRASSQAENEEIYNHLSNASDFRDIVYGNCGINVSDFALLGYDLCTGVGSDIGLSGK